VFILCPYGGGGALVDSMQEMDDVSKKPRVVHLQKKAYNNVRRSMNHGFTSTHISWKYVSFHIQSKGGEKDKVQPWHQGGKIT
jgi:hypothetical protein